MKQKQDLRILLLQIRDDKETMMEEFYEFVQFSGLREEQFTVLNTFITKDFDNSVINDHDALFVGGSSDASVLKPDEFLFVYDCQKLIRHCYNENIPVFASCFGFQLAIQELGGKVIVDQENKEFGTYQIHLTDEAKNDVLFYDTPNPFWAVSGHKERAINLPNNSILLGYSELCPIHAFKLIDKPFYGFQFHPEVDEKDLIARITRYQTRYFEDSSELERIKEISKQDVTNSTVLLSKFIERVVLD